MLPLTVGLFSLLWGTLSSLLFIGAPIHPSARLHHAMPFGDNTLRMLHAQSGVGGVRSSGFPSIAVLAGLGTGSLAGLAYSRAYSVLPSPIRTFEERVFDHSAQQLAGLEHDATHGHPLSRWDSSADMPRNPAYLTSPISHRLEYNSTHGLCADPLSRPIGWFATVTPNGHSAGNPTYLLSPISHHLGNNSTHGFCANPLSRPIGWSATQSPHTRSAGNPTYLTLPISHHLENNAAHGLCADPLSRLMGWFARILPDGHSEGIQTTIPAYPEVIDPESLPSDLSRFVHGSATITSQPAVTLFEFELRVRVALPTFLANFWRSALLLPSIALIVCLIYATLYLSQCHGFLRCAIRRLLSCLPQTFQGNSYIDFGHDIQRLATRTLASLVPEGGFVLEGFSELHVPCVVVRELLGISRSILTNAISVTDYLINVRDVQDVHIPSEPLALISPTTPTLVNQLHTESYRHRVSRAAVTALARQCLGYMKVAAGYAFVGVILLLLATVSLVFTLGIYILWLLYPGKTSSAQSERHGDKHATQISELHEPPTPEAGRTVGNILVRRGLPAQTLQKTPTLPRGPAEQAHSPLIPWSLATVMTAEDLAFFTDNIPTTSTPCSSPRSRYTMKAGTFAIDNARASTSPTLTDTLDIDLSVCTEASYYAMGNTKYNTRKTISCDSLSRVRVIEQQKTKEKLTMKTTKRLQETTTAILREVRVMTLLSSSIWCQALLGTSAADLSIDMYFEHHEQGNLGSYLFRRGGCLDRTLSVFYLAELLLALHEMHTMGITHGEVALHNILLSRDRHLVLSNFSSAQVFEQTGEEQDDDPTASVTQGREHVVEATHHYWLGCLGMAKVYHHMLTGCHPSYDIPPIRFRTTSTLRTLPEHRQVFSEDDLSVFQQVMNGFPEGRSGWLEMRRHPIFRGFDWDSMNEQLVPVPAAQCILTRNM